MAAGVHALAAVSLTCRNAACCSRPSL